MFEVLLVVGLIAVLIRSVVVISNREAETRNQLVQLQNQFDEKLHQRDQKWRQYIEAFKDRVESDEERALIQHILHGDGKTESREEEVPQTETHQPSPTQQPAPAQDQAPVATAQAQTLQEPKKSIDNGLLLLYLGAFLFVVAAGLFVGFADFSGVVRALVVALTTGLFYGAGIALHKYSRRLQPAGTAFAAIGMAIAPLVGLSLHAYVFEEVAGAYIWLGTSLVVFGMYLHALFTLRTGFTSYLLIFSLISLMQSSIAIFDAPIYYFIWMLIATGLIVKVIGHYAQNLNLPELEEPSHISSNIIVPLSVVVSLGTVFSDGIMQLAITLGFAALFYGLSAITAKGSSRVKLAQLAHLFAVSALATGIYDIAESLSDVALSLVVITALHALAALIAPKNKLYYALGANTLAMSIIAVVTAWSSDTVGLASGSNWILLSSLVTTAISGIILAYRQERIDGLLLGMVAVAVIPYIVGLRIIEPSLERGELALASLSGPLLLLGLRLLLRKQGRKQWITGSTLPFAVIAGLPLLTVAFANHPINGFIVSLVSASLFALLAKVEQRTLWEALSSLSVLAFIFQSLIFTLNPELTLSILFGFFWCVGVTLYFRSQVARWLGSILWFSIPIAIEMSGFDFSITAAHQSWMYIAVFVGFMLARTIVSVREDNSSASLQADTRHSGQAYITGYWAAGAASLFFGLMADNVSLQISLMSAILAVLFWTVGRYVEEDHRIVGIVPILMQIFVLAAINPSLTDTTEMAVYLLTSTTTALALYAVYKLKLSSWLAQSGSWRLAAIATLYVNPASLYIVGSTNIMMPIGLAIAGAITLLEKWKGVQGKRELTSFILVVALMWLLHHLGVDNLQAYTHIVALTFGLFALWRYTLDDRGRCDTYLKFMFLTATIPLALQAMGGQAGDIYGWMLIIQQIGFVLLGMAVNRKFLTKWGLFVTMGAVLYQMRDLEWAVLLILALSVIGAALYYINRHGNE